MQITIRDYRPDDLDHVKAITVAAFDGVSIAQNMEKLLGPVGGHHWTWHKARAIDIDVEHANMAVFVAEVHEEVVGVITTRIDREASIGFIPNIAVSQSRQGEGIGRQLLLHALEHFRSQGVTTAHIETLDQNPIGQHLYPAVGFREVARQIHFAMDLRTDQ